MAKEELAKQFIKIPHSIVRNNGISNMGKMIYFSLAMSRNINQTRLFQQTSINGLLGMVGYIQRTENQKMVKEGLIELEELQVVSIYSDLVLSNRICPMDLKGSTLFFVKFNDEYVYSEAFLNRFDDKEVDKHLIESGFSFTTVYIDDAVNILSNVSKHNKANLISCYLMTVSRALIGNMGDKYSTEPIELITKYANVNEKTATSYISSLFNSKLLFKLTLREFTKKGATIDHNVYSRWCERENIIYVIESNDWFMNKKLLKVGDKELSEAERNYLRNNSRKLHGLSEIY